MIPRSFSLSDFSLRLLALLTLLPAGAVLASSHTEGGKRVLVLVSQYPDEAIAKTEAQLQADYDAGFKIGQPGGVDEFYRRNSYGKTWFTEVKVRKVTLPNPKAYYSGQFNLALSHALTAAGESSANYDRVMSVAAGTISSTGLAYVGGTTSFYNGVQTGGVAIHELGHNWGNWHANFWKPNSSDPLDGSSSEYGNNFDNMGGTATSDWNSAKKLDIDFLKTSNTDGTKTLDVTASGTYRLVAHDSDASAPGAIRSLRLNRTGPSMGGATKLFVDYRQVQFGSNLYSWNGVHLYGEFAGSTAENLIDTNPLTPAPADEASDAPLLIGRTFYDPGANAYITPLSKVNGSSPPQIDVRVNIGPFAGNAAPTVSISANQTAPAANAPVALSTSATDTNGDTLAYAWDFGDGTFSTDSSATQTKSYSTNGWYRVTSTVSDMRGGSGTAALWLNVGNLANRVPEGGATVSGLSYRYYEGSFSTMPDFGKLLPKKSGTSATVDISPRERSDNFAFVFEGYLDVPSAGTYTFTVEGDDGFRLYLGETLVINSNTVKNSSEPKSTNFGLDAGKHRIRLEYFHKDGAEKLDLRWRGLTGDPMPIPASNFAQIDSSSNPAPVVSITAPADQTELVVGGSVQFQATASDSDGISKVQYFTDGSYLGESSTAPYNLTWNNVSVGTKSIVALAYDTTGRSTASAALTLFVVSPPPRQSIGINFNPENVAGGTLDWSDIAGAVYQQQNWNTLSDDASASSLSGSSTNLADSTGTATSADATWSGSANANYPDSSSNADTDTAPGKLMKGLLDIRQDESVRPTLTVSDIPFREYDVYVYFDMRSTSGDTGIIKFVLTPGTGTAPAPIFGRNSANGTDALGDYPNYDTWIGFKEATAVSTSDSSEKLFGNYVVFRGVTASSFTVRADSSTGSNMRTGMNAVQIVEAPASAPKIYVTSTNSSTTVTEGGATDAYSLSLGYPPTGNVTITVVPDAQLQVDRTSLVFTPENWQTPQFVSVSATDDTQPESSPHNGTITHTVIASGNYSPITSAASLSVSITDNDRPTVSVQAAGNGTETGTQPARFQITRTGSFSQALPIAFQMSGTATTTGDYVLSGASVSYNAGTGTLTLPANSAQTFVTLTPVDDTSSEGLETAQLTIIANPDYEIGTSAASVGIADNDQIQYFTQWFTGGNPFNLANKKLTFTPDGSDSFYSVSLETASSFPSPSSGHTNLESSGNLTGSVDDGFWTVNGMGAKFYGTIYSTLYVGTNGFVSFSSGETSTSPGSLADHFARRRVAGYWRDLHPGTAGDIFAGRITTPGQERTVVTYQNVARYDSASETISFQIEFFDSGVITITWLSCNPNATNPLVGFSNTTSGTPSGFVETNFNQIGGSEQTQNSLPVFASSPPTFATAGLPSTYTIHATDLNNDSLSFTAPTKPAWLTLTDLGNGTATLAGIPPASGSYPVTLRVSDGIGTVEQSYSLSVFPIGGNTAPAFNSTPPPGPWNVGAFYEYLIQATDGDGQIPSISSPVKPAWLTLTDHGNGTATLSGTAPDTEIVNFAVELAVTDGFSASAQSFVITLNRPPVVTITQPSRRAVELPDRTDSLVLNATAADPNGTPLTTTWSVVSAPTGGNVTFDSNSSLSTLAKFDLPGRYILRLTASDGSNSGSAELDVFVESNGNSSVLNSGLLAYWEANEAVGTTLLADASGGNRTLTLGTGIACAIAANGISGNALAFNGSNGAYAENTAFTQSAKSSLSFWIFPSAAPAAAEETVLQLQNNSTSRLRVFRPASSSRLRIMADWGTTDGVWEIPSNLPANAWSHIVINYDNGSTANDPLAYVNGSAVTISEIAAPAGSAQSAGNRIRLGADGSGTTRFTGSLDEVRVYNDLISAGDTTALFARSGERTSNLSAHWAFDEAIGRTLANDSSINDKDLTLGSGSSAVISSTGYDRHGISMNGNSNGKGDVTLTQPNQMTVSCWLWNNNSPTTAEENLWSVNNGGNVRLRVFRPANQRRLRISVDLSTTDGLWEIGRDIPANQWQHLTVSFDRTAAGNAPSAYLNGAPVPLTVLASPAGTVQTAGNGFRLGADGGSNNRWKGRMDEIRIFNRLVPAEEVPLLLLPNGINRAPDADAGAGREVAVNQTITLAGSATDDGQPAMEGGLTYEWALVSGPAGAQFGSPSSPGSTFTTGTSPGTYALVLFVSDGEATVAQSVELTVPAPPGFLGWLDGYDLPEESSGPNEDPDGDGIPNLLEYALAGGDPETSNANLLPQLSTVEENGEEYLTLTVNKNSAASGLTFHVEACGDLTNWVGGATHVTVISETADQLVVRDNTPISNSNERRFLRLRVSVP